MHLHIGFSRRAGSVALLLTAFVLLLLTPAPSQRTAAAAPDPLPAPVVVNGVEVPWTGVAADGSSQIHLYFGWTSTCPHCAKARPFIAEYAAGHPWLIVHNYQLDGDNDANVRFIGGLLEQVGAQLQGVPIFVFGGRYEFGFDEVDTTGRTLTAELEAFRAQVDAAAAAATASPGVSPVAGSPAPSAGSSTVIAVPFAGSVDMGGLALPLVTVVLASLDAVNPCALSVLLFLLGIVVGMGDRRRMLLVGGTYVLVSGLIYFFFMAAWPTSSCSSARCAS